MEPFGLHTTSDPSPSPLGEECATAVLMASRVLVGVAARSLAQRDEEVSLLQYRALVLLGSGDIGRPIQLAQALGITASAATRLCDRLERKTLISRERLGPDRRSVQLVLSGRGRALLGHVMQRRLNELRPIVARLSPSEQVQLIEAFERFAAAAAEVSDQNVFSWEEPADRPISRAP